MWPPLLPPAPTPTLHQLLPPFFLPGRGCHPGAPTRATSSVLLFSVTKLANSYLSTEC